MHYPDPPWFATGEVTTTYNYCDMCPWKCGIAVQSVDGKVIKVDGNANDPKSRGHVVRPRPSRCVVHVRPGPAAVPDDSHG